MASSVPKSTLGAKLYVFTGLMPTVFLVIIAYAGYWLLTNHRMNHPGQAARMELTAAVLARTSLPSDSDNTLALEVEADLNRIGSNRFKFFARNGYTADEAREAFIVHAVNISRHQSGTKEFDKELRELDRWGKSWSDRTPGRVSWPYFIWANDYATAGPSFRTPRGGTDKLRSWAIRYDNYVNHREGRPITVAESFRRWELIRFYDWKWANMCNEFPLLIGITMLLAGTLVRIVYVDYRRSGSLWRPRMQPITGGPPEKTGAASRWTTIWLPDPAGQWPVRTCCVTAAVLAPVLLGVELCLNRPQFWLERLINVPKMFIVAILGATILSALVKLSRIKAHPELQQRTEFFINAQFRPQLFSMAAGLSVVLFYLFVFHFFQLRHPNMPLQQKRSIIQLSLGAILFVFGLVAIIHIVREWTRVTRTAHAGDMTPDEKELNGPQPTKIEDFWLETGPRNTHTGILHTAIQSLLTTILFLQ